MGKIKELKKQQEAKMTKGQKTLNNYLKFTIKLLLVILIICIPFVVYQFVVYNKSGRADSEKNKEKVNTVLLDVRDKIYNKDDFEFSLELDGNKEEVILKDGKYDVFKNGAIIDYASDQNITAEISKYIPTQILLDVSLEGEDYIASNETMYYIKDGQSVSEEIDKIIVNQDGKYVILEDGENKINIDFK